MKRFGFAIRVGGDAEIAGALAAGIESGTKTTSSDPAEPGHLPLKGKALEDGGSGSDAVRRAAMWQHSPEEWAQMMEEARVIYGGRRYSPRWATRLLVGWAMLCYGVAWLYRQQDRIFERRAS